MYAEENNDELFKIAIIYLTTMIAVTCQAVLHTLVFELQLTVSNGNSNFELPICTRKLTMIMQMCSNFCVYHASSSESHQNIPILLVVKYN